MPIFVVMTIHSEKDRGRGVGVGEIEVKLEPRLSTGCLMKADRRQREFRATLLLCTTVCSGHKQKNSPGDSAVCLLIISGQDEPSSAVPHWDWAGFCVYVCVSLATTCETSTC